MVDITTILQNAILLVAGNEGLARFSKAGYSSRVEKMIHPDGSLDLPRLMNVMLDVFPEEQASAIADNVLEKYVEMSGEEQKRAEVAVEDARVEEEEPRDLSYEDNLARYLETEASDVRDMINEARKIRMAMGKGAPPKVAIGEAPWLQEKPRAVSEIRRVPDHETVPVEPPRVSIVKPVEPRQVELTIDRLDTEMKGFVDARKAYTSVDIMDFIRYLKDKGYHFQENSVLEGVYTWLEERKTRERAALLTDIQGFLERTPWPAESEVSAYVDQKKSEGVMCDVSEIKRMILVEMIRKH
jgi:hypothetical protein